MSDMSFWDLLRSVLTIAAIQWLMAPETILAIGKRVGRRRRRKFASDERDAAPIVAGVRRAQLASRALHARPGRVLAFSILAATVPGVGMWMISMQTPEAFVLAAIVAFALGWVVASRLPAIFDAVAAARCGHLTEEQARSGLESIPYLR